MYPVTQDFLEKMKATERRVYGRIQIDYTDPFLDQSIQVQASEQANISYPTQTADTISEPFVKIASLDGSWVLDGTFALAPDPDEAETHQMGWWGSQLSQADGTFVSPYPSLTVTHFARPIHNLKVVGDSARGEYPVDFTIDLYAADGTKLYTKSVTGNNQVNWTYQLPSPVLDVTKQVLTITKWSHAGRQVKILEFFTSIQETYEGDDILLIHLLEEREVSQGSLPVGNISANEIDIRLNNASRKFDAGNKQSPLYQLLKQNRRIKAWLGLKGDGEGTNLQQSVDFTQGTLNNLVVVNNKLQLPSVAAPSFTRNSIAYLSDGTLVNTNLPRYETGKFGKAIMVEEGTTNLVANGSFENGTTGWTLSSNMSITNTNKYFGSYCLMISNPTGAQETDSSIITVSPNVTYTLSAYVYNQMSGSMRIYVKELDSNNNLIDLDKYGFEVSPNSGWTRYTYTWTTPSNVAKVQVRVIVDVARTGNCYIDGIQLEAKPYATSFIDGTRSPETLTIPTAGVLNPQEGTVECWVYIDNRFINGMAGKYAWIWGTKGIPYYPILNLYRNGPTNTLRFVSRDANNNQSYIEKPLSQISVGWHYIACTWKSSRLAFLLDGQLVGEVVSPYLPNAVDAQMYIGHNPSAGEQCNSLIDDLRISSRARTDEEIAAAYQSGQPLPVDEWTTYKLNFDGNLNFGQGGYYLSPEFDLSAVGTAVGSKISWQEDADGIQRSVYAKLDNQADWTQVVNGGKLPIGYGDVLTGRKLQLKAKLLKSA
jgi:hypothetical protein